MPQGAVSEDGPYNGLAARPMRVSPQRKVKSGEKAELE